MPAWPASLPQYPLADNYAVTFADNVIRSDTETGPAKVRRRGTAAPVKVQAVFRFTAAQYAAFASFVAVDLKDRSLSYTWPDPIEGGSYSWRIVEPPQAAPMAGGAFWRVGLSLERLP